MSTDQKKNAHMSADIQVSINDIVVLAVSATDEYAIPMARAVGLSLIYPDWKERAYTLDDGTVTFRWSNYDTDENAALTCTNRVAFQAFQEGFNGGLQSLYAKIATARQAGDIQRYSMLSAKFAEITSRAQAVGVSEPWWVQVKLHDANGETV